MDQEKKNEEDLSTEQINEFFDLLEKLPIPSLSRNDPCLCGSGLKYKKCCLTQNRLLPSSASQLESFEIKTDYLTPEESQDDFPDISPEDEELMEGLYFELCYGQDSIDSENCDYFKKLYSLQDKYQDNPVILNYIANGYDLLGEQDKLEELISKTYEKFPNYLFAKTAKANIYLRDGFPEKALEVLKGAYTLKQLYPHRTVFHITEVRVFEHFMVLYFCEKENIEQANRHLQFMKNVLEEDDPLLQSAERIFKKSKVLYNFKTRMSLLLNSAKKKSDTQNEL